MTNIALRSYHRKIETLIENHNIDEALSHCINIIQKYPKEIETYRKLGKIFLEKPDMHIAEDIFKNILCVYPDDFVANIGLSFIAEQDKNWDGAIRYMECAFDIQPANESLQDELKRLYNKRDGIEPSKIRLTRGALIKMYSRSKLYEQAIAEIRLGLYEKPSRLDFKLALADMLWQSGKNIDAIQTCVEVISQLPYCWTANEILYKAFLNFNKVSKENYYQTRLIELNPYYEFMLPTTINVNDVPDVAVQLDDNLSNHVPVDQFDWDNFLEKTWITPSDSEKADLKQDELDWASILGEVIEKNHYDLVPDKNVDVNKETENAVSGNRRDAFIDRIQKRASQIIAEEAIQAKEGIESSLQKESSDRNNDFIPIESSPDLIPEQSDPSMEIPDFPAVPDESGLVDMDAPVMELVNENKEPISSAWAPAVEESQLYEDIIKPSIEDTQQIKVGDDSPDEIMMKASKAIEGGNYQFAIKHFLKLSEDPQYLEEIKNILEDACKTHAQESDLWLTLGNIYQRLDMKEKALEVFIRAQKHISL